MKAEELDGNNHTDTLGLALRSTVFQPVETVQLLKSFEERFPRLTKIFLPDIAGSFDPIEMTVSALSKTERLMVGPGVIRIFEHDETQLARRLATIQKISKGRLLLGAGLGRIPSEANLSRLIGDFATRVSSLKKQVELFNDVSAPKIYVAALGSKLAIRTAPVCDGILLNFCSPSYAGQVLRKVKATKTLDFACYIKLFFSISDESAVKNMVREFINYDSMPQYHRLFVRQGVADDIGALREKGDRYQMKEIPESLLKISLSNPGSQEIASIVKDMRHEGITLPVIYPYFDRTDPEDYKERKLIEVLDALT